MALRRTKIASGAEDSAAPADHPPNAAAAAPSNNRSAGLDVGRKRRRAGEGSSSTDIAEIPWASFRDGLAELDPSAVLAILRALPSFQSDMGKLLTPKQYSSAVTAAGDAEKPKSVLDGGRPLRSLVPKAGGGDLLVERCGGRLLVSAAAAAPSGLDEPLGGVRIRPKRAAAAKVTTAYVVSHAADDSDDAYSGDDASDDDDDDSESTDSGEDASWGRGRAAKRPRLTAEAKTAAGTPAAPQKWLLPTQASFILDIKRLLLTASGHPTPCFDPRLLEQLAIPRLSNGVKTFFKEAGPMVRCVYALLANCVCSHSDLSPSISLFCLRRFESCFSSGLSSGILVLVPYRAASSTTLWMPSRSWCWARRPTRKPSNPTSPLHW